MRQLEGVTTLSLLISLAVAACTRALPAPPRRRLIVGGQEASRGEFPYMCSIRTKAGQHVCGATLIAPRLALTAAYCVSLPNGVPDPLLLCGLFELYDQAPGTYDVLQTVRTIINEGYQPSTFSNDVALLELNASAQHGMPIGGTIIHFNYTEGYLLTAIGWGYAGGTIISQAERLRHAELPIVPYSVCNTPGAYAGAVLEPEMFCAGFLNGSADTCSGDSGGAIVDLHGSSDSADQLQAGIVSWGAGCGLAGWPGVYTRLDAFQGFIDSHGYCGCTTTGRSGAVETAMPGCTAQVVQQEQQASAAAVGAPDTGQQQACYIINPARCSYGTPSHLWHGAVFAPCNSDTNLTIWPGQLGLIPAAEVTGDL